MRASEPELGTKEEKLAERARLKAAKASKKRKRKEAKMRHKGMRKVSCTVTLAADINTIEDLSDARAAFEEEFEQKIAEQLPSINITAEDIFIDNIIAKTTTLPRVIQEEDIGELSLGPETKAEASLAQFQAHLQSFETHDAELSKMTSDYVKASVLDKSSDVWNGIHEKQELKDR
eukprot:COSAG05_NODE_11156_length_528_cov_0.629371_1_plen_175_part_11